MLIHGTAVAIAGRAVLLTGPSGSGKSDLALRLISDGAALIADDAVIIAYVTNTLIVRRPDVGAERLTVRGVGMIAATRSSESAPFALAIRLVATPLDDLEPQLGAAGPWHSVFIPEIALYPFEASASAKVMLALDRFGH